MLSDDNKADIRLKRASDPNLWSLSALAKLYGVSSSYICKILNGTVNAYSPPTGRKRGRKPGGGRLFTPAQIRSIRSDPRLLKEIAKDYDVTISTIVQIRQRQIYKSVF